MEALTQSGASAVVPEAMSSSSSFTELSLETDSEMMWISSPGTIFSCGIPSMLNLALHLV